MAAKELVNIATPIKVLNSHEGVRSIIIFNPNAVAKLFISRDKETILDGIPLGANGNFGPVLWSGDLWVGTDTDGAVFNKLISDVLNFDNSTMNRNTNVRPSSSGIPRPANFS